MLEILTVVLQFTTAVMSLCYVIIQETKKDKKIQPTPKINKKSDFSGNSDKSNQKTINIQGDITTTLIMPPPDTRTKKKTKSIDSEVLNLLAIVFTVLSLYLFIRHNSIMYIINTVTYITLMILISYCPIKKKLLWLPVNICMMAVNLIVNNPKFWTNGMMDLHQYLSTQKGMSFVDIIASFIENSNESFKMLALSLFSGLSLIFGIYLIFALIKCIIKVKKNEWDNKLEKKLNSSFLISACSPSIFLLLYFVFSFIYR